MMIKCVKCGHENQLGSIFCHGCGEKIDMDQLSPEVMAQKSKQNRQSKAKKQMINNIIALVIFTICAAIVCAVLIPNGQKQRPSGPSDEIKASAAEKLKLVNKAVPNSTVSFTAEELTGLWSGKFTITPAEGAFFEAGSLFFEWNEDSDVLSAYLTTRVQQNFNVTLRADISPEKSDDDPPYEFNVSYAQMGHLPFFFLQNIVTQQYAPVLEQQEIKNAFSKAKSVAFENGLLTFNF